MPGLELPHAPKPSPVHTHVWRLSVYQSILPCSLACLWLVRMSGVKKMTVKDWLGFDCNTGQRPLTNILPLIPATLNRSGNKVKKLALHSFFWRTCRSKQCMRLGLRQAQGTVGPNPTEDRRVPSVHRTSLSRQNPGPRPTSANLQCALFFQKGARTGELVWGKNILWKSQQTQSARQSWLTTFVPRSIRTWKPKPLCHDQRNSFRICLLEQCGSKTDLHRGDKREDFAWSSHSMICTCHGFVAETSGQALCGHRHPSVPAQVQGVWAAITQDFLEKSQDIRGPKVHCVYF